MTYLQNFTMRGGNLCSLRGLQFSRRIIQQRFNYSTNNVSKDEEESIIVKQVGEITTIGINRPEKRNCLNYKVANQLSDAITSFEEDENARVGIIYGTGGNFCSGYDLKEMAEDNDLGQKMHNLRLTDRFVSKPLIAAVSGYAVGAGFDLALWCDLRVVEETAVMGFFQRRFGIAQPTGVLERLEHMVGLSTSLDWVLTGRIIKPKEAQACGIVARVVACGSSLGQAMNLGNSIAKFPPSCLAADRAGLYLSVLSPTHIQSGLVSNQREHYLKQSNQEAIEGAKKFVSGIGKRGKTSYIKPLEDSLDQ